jgi:bifunctional UDP-N-acetylglucosamine pyrophosphorylase / glucosamine-1-phosphate N-acetyltransferase
MALSVVILAAGQGTRMRSAQPKVLHELAGKPMLEHVISTALGLSDDVYVVHGHGSEEVKSVLSDQPVNWVFQSEQLGTGHAVLQALPAIADDNRVLVLYGDVPLISQASLTHLLERTPEDGVGWLTVTLDHPTGLGRIVRDDDNNPVAIVEERDASDLQKTIREINSGICLLPAKHIKQWLPNLNNDNSQHEYYLTDVFSIAISQGISIVTVSPISVIEVEGVNDKVQLAELERAYQTRVAKRLMLQGLTLRDPARFDLRGELSFGQDVVVDVNVVFEGCVTLGSNVYIGPNCVLKNCQIGDNTRIESHSLLDSSEVGVDCTVGPFARLRPNSVMHDQAKVGNFVEMKKSTLGKGSKASHLAYLGDTTIGQKANIGAGTITCNYDGVNKHQTTIGDEAFIGSNTSLVAPVDIGEGATIGAGSTISKSAPAKQLTVARSKQTTLANWTRPKKVKSD